MLFNNLYAKNNFAQKKHPVKTQVAHLQNFTKIKKYKSM